MKWQLFKIMLAALALIPAANGSTHPKDSATKVRSLRWAVQKASTLSIQGTTNVSSFGCGLEGYYKPDTIICQAEVSNEPVSLKGELEIDISRFDCHNRMLTSDLRKTLKADQYPKFFVRFLSFERAPFLSGNYDKLKGVIELELAGVCRRFEICYDLAKTSSGLIKLNGNRTFCFGDFKLTPPHKAGGLIKVHDQFNVDFNLLLIAVQ